MFEHGLTNEIGKLNVERLFSKFEFNSDSLPGRAGLLPPYCFICIDQHCLMVSSAEERGKLPVHWLNLHPLPASTADGLNNGTYSVDWPCMYMRSRIMQ